MTQFDRIAQPEPNAAMTRPASAGPMIRPALKLAELSPTALAMCCLPATSDTNACRAGLSNAVPSPKASATTKTCQVWATPVTASRPSTAAQTASQPWVRRRIRRLSKRSAIRPPYGESTSIGRNCSPVVTPTARAEPCDSSSTSQSCATRCIHVPMFETKAPPK